MEPGARARRLGLLAACLLALVVFSNALTGDFVYDDVVQIQENPLIQRGGDLARALASESWAFLGSRDAPFSHYFRPAFVLWLAANARLWGVTNPAGWHAANLLLHLLILAALSRLLRYLEVDGRLAAAVLLIAALHPTRSEAVAWVIGAPDLLLALGLVLALGSVAALAKRGSAGAWATGVLGYLLALGAKEVALLFPAVAFVAVWALAREQGASGRAAARRAALTALPFALLAGAFFAVRLAVLGRVVLDVPGRVPLAQVALTAPSLVVFYLRHALLPGKLGLQYPLRVVSAPGLLAFAAPLAVAAATLLALALLARRSAARAVGLALFLAPLVLLLNVNAFDKRSLVHDRYLYVPLIGLLLLLVPAAAGGLRRAGLPAERAARGVLAGAALLCLPLGVRARDAAATWRSEVALFGRAAETDPGAPEMRAEYARALHEAGREDEARRELQRAFGLGDPGSGGYLLRAKLAMAERRFESARNDYLHLVRVRPDEPGYWERLAACFQAEGQPALAEKVLREGRGRFPWRRCGFTDNLGALLYGAGRREEAVAELESVREAAPKELGAEAAGVFFHLGLIYAEARRLPEARRALSEYLEVSAPYHDPETLRRRLRSREVLAGLPAR